MRIFICWSESRSGQLADKLSTWLNQVLGPEATCTLSTGFQPGRPWFPQLIRELNEADAALICFTPENVSSLWMHFEAGMVFRFGDERVLPYFLGSEAVGIKEPLNSIQASTATKEGTRRLVEALASRGGIKQDQVAERFAKLWPELETFLRRLAAPRFAALFPEFEELFNRKTFTERIEDCTDQGWITRYDIVRQTLDLLKRQRAVVQTCCQPWQAWLFQKLINHVDGYARELCENLLAERHFEVSESNKVDFTRPRKATLKPIGPVSAACAYRCREIGHIVFCLTRPEGAPVLAEALDFAKLTRDQFDDKKRLVQATGVPVVPAALGLESDAELEACARSLWQYDRIIYYKVRESAPTDIDTMTSLVEREWLEAEAEGAAASKMPLHYAIKAWLAALEKAAAEPFNARIVERVMSGVQAYLDRTAKSDDSDPKIRSYLKLIGEMLNRRTPSVG
ncbi:MAG TPA: hypothetical protein VFR86_06035 [Burkholderiaceae bacterium]|nr:hypothetical protein [Burkholderiaceae bacterium]